MKPESAEPAAPESSPHAVGLLVEFWVAVLWLALPIGVWLGRQIVLPMFNELGVEMPIGVRLLLSPYSIGLLTIASTGLIIALFSIPRGSNRRMLIGYAVAVGMLVCLLCTLVIVLPMVSLWQSLS